MHRTLEKKRASVSGVPLRPIAPYGPHLHMMTLGPHALPPPYNLHVLYDRANL